MEANTKERYELIRSIASKDWLHPSSVSLARLDQVKTNVYNLGAVDSRALKTSPGPTTIAKPPVYRSRRKPKPYTELETEPPLSTLSYQKTAWGSNMSIPELLQNQAERARQRKENTKTIKRPWSGKRPPPSPSANQMLSAKPRPQSASSRLTQNHNQTTDEIDITKPLFGVKGEHWTPQSRPPSSKPERDLDQVSQKQVEHWIQEFIDVQEDVQPNIIDAGLKSSSKLATPPAPCSSPELGQPAAGEDEEGEAKPDKEIQVKQPPRMLLRRPTPEPITLSIPTAEISEEYGNSGGLFSGDLEFLNESLGSLDGKEEHTVILYTKEGTDNTAEDTAKKPSESSIRIAEENNVTIPISPRTAVIKRKDLKQGVRRPHSAKETGNPTRERSNKLSRPSSAKVKMAAVSVRFGDEDGGEDGGEQDGVEKRAQKVTETLQKSRKRKEIETMMSKMTLYGEEGPGDGQKVPPAQIQQRSAKTKNYYKVAMDTTPGQVQTAGAEVRGGDAHRVKTVKTIEMKESGQLEESKTLAVMEPPQANTVAENVTRPVMNRPQHAIRKVKSTPLERPSSRMSLRSREEGEHSLEEDGQKEVAEQTSTQQDTRGEKVNKRLFRPFSAPTKKAVSAGTGAKSPHHLPSSPGTVRQRPKSATTANKHGGTAQMAYGNSSRGIVPSKLSLAEKRRNREAVKALREGTLFKEKPMGPTDTVSPVKPKSLELVEEKPKKPKSPVEEPPIEVDSDDEEKFRHMHKALFEKGIDVPLNTLKRSLMPPAEKDHAECVSNLPVSNLPESSILLSHPEKWLGEVFQKYKLADKALRQANLRMAEQQERDAKMNQLQSKTKKKKSVKKKVLKKKKSSTS